MVSSLIDKRIDEAALATSMPTEVEMEEPSRFLSDMEATFEFTDNEANPDGGVMVTFGEDHGYSPDETSMDHFANLSSFLSDHDNARIADEILDMVEADKESMAPWKEKLKRGLEIMGVVLAAEDELPFDGASAVVHPLLAEAVVQFNARSGAELLPPAGPCKGLVIGDQTAEKREQAARVEEHMNYQMTEEDAGYYDEIDSLLFYLPFAGSAFTKTYWDDLRFRTTTRFVKAEHLIAPYTATSLENAPRYTLYEAIDRNEMRKRMASGFYRDIPLVDPVFMDDDDIRALYDEAEGREASLHEDDAEHDTYEMYINYDLPGFEDPDGIALPYIITVDKYTRTCLSIRRNWRKNDPTRQVRHYVEHYKYLPGFGLLGFGLVHIIGGLAEACTGSMRALLDSAAFATLQGGFKTKDARFPAGEHIMRPGCWEDVDMSADELAKAFYTPPFKEPSRALFQMLELLEENGRRFAGTTEAVVGDAANSGPVGTTVALIEQGTKIMSGIHKRLHRAQRREFSIRAEINAEFLPQGQEIYYDTANGSNFITTNDYTNRSVNVVPVSDPNITSSTQRIAQAQALSQRADEKPELYRPHRVEQRLLEALDVDDSEQYLRDPEKKHRFDAMSEGSRIMAKMPIFAFQDQNHESHIAVHMAQIEYYKTLPEEHGGPLIMQMTDHLAKHEAYRIYQRMNMMSGNQLPDIDLYDDDPQEAMPPEVDEMVTAQTLQFIQQLMAEIEQNKQPPAPDMEAQAKIQREAMKHEQDLRQDEEEHQQELRQAEEKFQQKQRQELADSDPNSAQENIMRALGEQQRQIATLTSLVMPLINTLVPQQPSNSPTEGQNDEKAIPI